MNKKILCIDDSNTALVLLDYALKEAGYDAILAFTVEEAIQKLQEEKPDLILLDLSMPMVSGYEFLEMREKLKVDTIPIIVVSAYDSLDSINTTRKLGAVDFISKPIKIEAIINKIKARLA
jgi:two-component system response regulator VicR